MKWKQINKKVVVSKKACYLYDGALNIVSIIGQGEGLVVKGIVEINNSKFLVLEHEQFRVVNLLNFI